MRVPYIIAEAGSCHEGLRDRALDLLYIATKAGANAIKYQFWSSPQRMRERRHVDDERAYIFGSILSEWLPTLRDVAHKSGLGFMCTAYLPEDIPVVAEYVDAFKVSSFEATPGFVALHEKYGKPVYVSTGMHTAFGSPPYQHWVRKLHCVSSYPCPVEEANLGAIYRCGYSDHTRNVLTGAVAVGAGATVLEVHFRLDDTSPLCPDYCVSLSPEELRQYIANARLASVLMGDGVKRIMPSEEENVKHKVKGP